MVGDQRQGWVLLAVMALIWVLVVGFTTLFELNGNPKLDALKVDQSTTSSQPGGNFEGKEIRNGTPASALWAASTTEPRTVRSTRCTSRTRPSAA